MPFIDYEIHLSDKALVAQLQAEAGRVNVPRNDLNGDLVSFPTLPLGSPPFAGSLFASPQRAAIEFGATIVPVGTQKPLAPYIASPWITDLAQTFPPLDQDELTLPIGATFWNVVLTFEVQITWRGRYVYTPVEPTEGGVPVGPGAPPIQKLMFADGFEVPTAGAGGSTGAFADNVSAEASRHPGGLGLICTNPAGGSVKTHATDEIQTGIMPTEVWQRFYMRPRVLPSDVYEFWRIHLTVSSSQGVALAQLPSGQIGIYNVDLSNVRTQMAVATVTTPTVDKWWKFDVFVKSGAGSELRLFINGVHQVTITGFPSNGLGGAGFLRNSDLGNPGVTSPIVSAHFDDWTCADYPGTFQGLDFLNGSKLVRLDPIAYGPGHDAVAWPGDIDELRQLPAINALTPGTTHQSTTALSQLEAALDWEKVAKDPHAINGGVIAIVFGVFSSVTADPDDGTLSYSINGAAMVDLVLNDGVSLAWKIAGYLPSALTQPEQLTGLLARYTKANVGTNANVQSLQATAVMLGVFSEEDIIPEAGIPITPPDPPTGLHNHFMLDSPWSRHGAAPISPVIIKSGIYTGNATSLELRFNAPVSWLWVRRVSNHDNGAHWFSGMYSPTKGMQQPYDPEAWLVPSWVPFDPPNPVDGFFGEFVARIVGSDASSNAAGVDYQYIAFMDPGMRFCLSFHDRLHKGTVDQVTSLWVPTFLPQVLWGHRFTRSGAATINHYFKGIGHGAEEISPVNLTKIAAAVSVAQGSITTKSAYHHAGEESHFCAFRMNDGSADPGIERVVRIGTYTGDGSASRTITFGTGGKRPIFVYVQPHNGAGFQRDPSHTGTTSTQVNPGTSNAATGITAGGIDTFTVGSALNTNGIQFDYFVIVGCDTAGNGGWSVNCEHQPVTPIPPPEWPTPPGPELPPEPVEPPEPGPGGPGGPEPPGPGGGDFEQCPTESQKICQQALAFIGITEPIVDIVTDNTPQAYGCRLFYADTANEALREFPWDFATKYADLQWLSGTETVPFNQDWRYSWRAPSDMVFPRRLVRPEYGRRADPDPPPFRLHGPDTAGRRLVSNYTDPTYTPTLAAPVRVQLEYTYRSTCVATAGDDLFKLAFAWLLASKLAPGLSRNKMTAADCWTMFAQTVERARTMNARAQQQEPPQLDPDWIRGR